MKVGDIVHLKSDGPKMTVQCTVKGNPNGDIKCTWFTKRQTTTNESIFDGPFREIFKEEQLILHKE